MPFEKTNMRIDDSQRSEWRCGRFYIDTCAIDQIGKWLTDFTPIRCEYHADRLAYMFVGCHPDFDPVQRGHPIGEYVAKMETVSVEDSPYPNSVRTVFRGFERQTSPYDRIRALESENESLRRTVDDLTPKPGGIKFVDEKRDSSGRGPAEIPIVESTPDPRFGTRGN